MQMADGDSQSISGVGRLWNLIEIQQARHHLLHLMFFGAAVSDHCRLDGERSVFCYFSPAEAAASIATPRTCPSFKADFTLAA